MRHDEGGSGPRIGGAGAVSRLQGHGLFSGGTKAAPSTPLRPEWSGQSEQAGGAGPPSTPLLHRGREPLPRDAAWRLRSPSVGQSHPQKRWTRMWTKSVAGDSEAPSLESRWMWRYPVGSVATCQVLCAPRPTQQGQDRGGRKPHPTPWAQGTLSEDIRGQANRVSEARTPIPLHPRQPCFRLSRGSVNWPTKSLGEVAS